MSQSVARIFFVIQLVIIAWTLIPKQTLELKTACTMLLLNYLSMKAAYCWKGGHNAVFFGSSSLNNSVIERLQSS